MGVEAVASARPRASAASPTTQEATKSHALYTPTPSPAPRSPLALDELSRRRTSIPSSFTFGTDDHDELSAAASSESERRWRSFDVTTTSLSVSSSSRLATLASRIQSERQQLSAAEHAARPSRRRRRALLSTFLSASRKEQIELRRMEMVAQVAKCNRSLVVLRDTLTSLELSAHELGSASSPTALVLEDDMAIDADAVLADDCVHHILERQLHFLRQSVALHSDKTLEAPRAATPTIALQQFLSAYVESGVPCAMDAPTLALVRFEKLLAKHKVLKPTLKRSLDRLGRDTMESFTHPQYTSDQSNSAASIWATRAPQDVLPSLVRELEESVIESAPVTETVRGVLHTFLEQMVFSRLAGACYRPLAVELDEQNAVWRDQTAKARRLQLDEVGLPMETEVQSLDTEVLTQSIDAFNALPHLVPSSVLSAFLSAVRVLYSEAQTLLDIPSGCVSADVLLPLLVFVLSRSELPHLHAQVFLMEQFAIDESQDGSEAAYYLACLQAAMGYIMTEVGKAQ